MSVLIAPSILSGDFANLGQTVADLQASGADWIHVDVMDGCFVPNLTIGPQVVAALRPYAKIPFDVHLMIAQPERSIDHYVRAGADRITVHAEATVHLQRTLTAIREAGAKVGVAFNPSTSVEILPYIADVIDLVLVMTVNPGFGGQSFIPATLHKIKSVHEKLRELGRESVEIEVDGGVNEQTARLCTEAGATVLVAGSHVFSAPSLAHGITSLRV